MKINLLLIGLLPIALGLCGLIAFFFFTKNPEKEMLDLEIGSNNDSNSQ